MNAEERRSYNREAQRRYRAQNRERVNRLARERRAAALDEFRTYERERRHRLGLNVPKGSPEHLAKIAARRTPREELFWAKVRKTRTCWLWTGAINVYGYGVFWNKKAHRVAYELLVGPIPDGLTIDHLCFNPPCVNPAHLEPVTRAENSRRARLHEQGR